jgi:hypothetical protein
MFIISRITSTRSGKFLQSLIATIETLHDKLLMDQLNKSGKDTEHGKVRIARDFLDEL